MDWKTLPSDRVENSAASLTKALNEHHKSRWGYHLVGKRPRFGVIYDASIGWGYWYQIVDRAMHTGKFSRLKRCRMCRVFFTTKDHRERYCNKKCFKGHERSRVAVYRKEDKARQLIIDGEPDREVRRATGFTQGKINRIKQKYLEME